MTTNLPQAGEYWRIRNGNVVGPLTSFPYTNSLGILDVKNWDAKGKSLDDFEDYDLVERVKVEPFPRPVSRTHTIYVVTNGDAIACCTREDVLRMYKKSKWEVFAGPITITEGQKDETP